VVCGRLVGLEVCKYGTCYDFGADAYEKGNLVDIPDAKIELRRGCFRGAGRLPLNETRLFTSCDPPGIPNPRVWHQAKFGDMSIMI
jgi:hypothetical protein